MINLFDEKLSFILECPKLLGNLFDENVTRKERGKNDK
jgi:hypothetical protein